MARTAIHPGEILADELAELKMTAAELAREIGVPANRITQITAGKRGISADTALRIGKWFGTGPKIWMNLQQMYDLDVVSQQLTETLKNIKTRETAS
ncbi:HigA family addiction module antitoxin [Desulfobulbus alkaliphilus]|uniref:HigA family addiction module antitoxin n=1 Tax=Desulfobulbus alkaliphilus TaxID=869814 RepID=UPI0019635613|nr:HigA family addiction module antitoxin [Desulfobulbus alkaliphilus]MBM9536214.1 HigA family addiction module antidote protein [Desulfobulbus alkaliphilus]